MEANKIVQHIECAVEDIAYNEVQSWQRGAFCDGKKILDEMGTNNVKDLVGAYADHLYNDVPTLIDLLFDSIYAEVPYKEERLELAEELSHARSFTAWEEAMKAVITSIKKHSKE